MLECEARFHHDAPDAPILLINGLVLLGKSLQETHGFLYHQI